MSASTIATEAQIQFANASRAAAGFPSRKCNAVTLKSGRTYQMEPWHHHEAFSADLLTLDENDFVAKYNLRTHPDNDRLAAQNLTATATTESAR